MIEITVHDNDKKCFVFISVIQCVASFVSGISKNKNATFNLSMCVGYWVMTCIVTTCESRIKTSIETQAHFVMLKFWYCFVFLLFVCDVCSFIVF